MRKLMILMKFELENLTRFPILELILLFLAIASFSPPAVASASFSTLGEEVYSRISFIVSKYFISSFSTSYVPTVIVTSSLIAASLAFEMETGQIELLLLQPIRRGDVLLSKILSISFIVVSIQLLSALLSSATYYHKFVVYISLASLLISLYLSLLSVMLSMSLTLAIFAVLKRSLLSTMVALIALISPAFANVKFLPPRAFLRATDLDFLGLLGDTCVMLLMSFFLLVLEYYLYTRRVGT
jgi:ABC-type transport system involved in multi-copper enzyme maturation permease subunit